jgi:ubiquinone/menaquinone biosynthesis C-methylase UbiE
MAEIQADFDRIALFSNDEWNHNSHYHAFLLKRVPPHCTEALEIGCGTGGFARLLAQRAERVVAMDLAPQMIRIARDRARHIANIEFQVADAVTWQFPPERFDCIVSIATLHHLPPGEMLSKMKHSLTADGILLILDLFRGEGLSDVLASMLAAPVAAALKLIKLGRLRESAEVRAAWAAHGRHESYLSLSEIRKTCAGILPGAAVTRHLLWRYSIVWKKPGP